MVMSETRICNLALAKLGANRISALTENSVEAKYCNIQYEPTRDAMLRSHWWRFATKRATLSQDTNTPDFGWSYQYELPSDFLRMMHVHLDGNTPNTETLYSYTVEGNLILSNESTMEIRYIARITDVTEFDPLFVQVLAQQLALNLAMPLSKGPKLTQALQQEMQVLMQQVRAIDRQETNTTGREDMGTWNDARWGI
jgi:hypothetical protein